MNLNLNEVETIRSRGDSASITKGKVYRLSSVQTHRFAIINDRDIQEYFPKHLFTEFFSVEKMREDNPQGEDYWDRVEKMSGAIAKNTHDTIPKLRESQKLMANYIVDAAKSIIDEIDKRKENKL